MKAIPTDLPEVLILEPTVFGDARGFFMESYNQQVFNEAVGCAVDFVQDNHSRSRRGVLRGLHYQLPPNPQAKLVRVTSGRVFDVAVDVRRSSAHFGKWIGVELSEENQRQLWLPAGFAHGFLVLSDSADVLYKASSYYRPESEVSIRWDDPQVGITWPEIDMAPVVSARDLAAKPLSEARVYE